MGGCQITQEEEKRRITGRLHTGRGEQRTLKNERESSKQPHMVYMLPPPTLLPSYSLDVPSHYV